MNREQFYKSKQWESFRKVIINERTNEDGFVVCAICGQPILKKYDLVVHHKRELDDMNVNDASVALNPDNVECVHFKCHNKIHHRFQGGDCKNTFVPKKVYIVYGSPCSGKSTWVKDNASANDLVVDLDSIWQMISVNDRYTKPNALKAVVFTVRDNLYDQIKYRNGRWHTAYIITGGALKGDRDRLVQRVGADDCIFIDTSKEECLKRVSSKGLTNDDAVKWIEYINQWFDSYQSD